jgi:hypothetical protein
MQLRQAFRTATTAPSSTLNPKVAGSIPARPIKIPGVPEVSDTSATLAMYPFPVCWTEMGACVGEDRDGLRKGVEQGRHLIHF